MDKSVQNLVEASGRLLEQFEYLVEMCDPDGDVGTHIEWVVDTQRAIDAVKISQKIN